MNAQQKALFRTLLPRFCKLHTPPDVNLVVVEIDTRLRNDDAYELLEEMRGFLLVDADLPLPAKKEYLGGKWALNQFWCALPETGAEQARDGFFKLGAEAGKLLDEWATEKGVCESTVEESWGVGISAWINALFDLAKATKLGPMRIYTSRRLTSRNRFEIGPPDGAASFVDCWTGKPFVPAVAYAYCIPDAIRASCYAIEYLASPSETNPEPDSGHRNGKISRDEANIRARGILREHPTISARDLAKQIGCSSGLISKLPAWQKVQERLKAGAQPRHPKTVSLSDALLATTGLEDDPLKKLIAEQEADREPSPLDEDEPDRPCRVYGRR